jgi:hypothetical protein
VPSVSSAKHTISSRFFSECPMMISENSLRLFKIYTVLSDIFFCFAAVPFKFYFIHSLPPFFFSVSANNLLIFSTGTPLQPVCSYFRRQLATQREICQAQKAEIVG